MDNNNKVGEVGCIVVVRGNLCLLPGELVLESIGLVGVKAIVWYNVLILVLTQILLRMIGYCSLGETGRAIYLVCKSFSGQRIIEYSVLAQARCLIIRPCMVDLLFSAFELFLNNMINYDSFMKALRSLAFLGIKLAKMNAPQTAKTVLLKHSANKKQRYPI